jgi:hypothetical protein
MLKENGLLIFLIVLILGLGLAMKFFSNQGGGLPVPELGEATVTPAETDLDNPDVFADFEDRGNIINQNGQWIFVYEEPGAPALTVVLNFTDNSLCQFNSEASKCNLDELSNGMRIQVEGRKVDDQLTVTSLTEIE